MSRQPHPVECPPLLESAPPVVMPKPTRAGSFTRWARLLPVVLIGGLAVIGLLAYCLTRDTLAPGVDLTPYLYQDTRRLVLFVEEAAEYLTRRGPACFEEFKVKNSRWYRGDRYLFVYDLEGRCLFHPSLPTLMGRELIDFRDILGKPVIRMITDIGRQPGDRAHGWVFYLWESGEQILPLWKSSYIRKVIGPDGRIYLIGSGSYNLKMEKVFVQQRVDQAAQLLEREGKPAFAQLCDPASDYHFLDTFIFVLDFNGRTLVDPAYPTLQGRNLYNFQDLSGRFVIRAMVETLRSKETGWLQYRWHRPDMVQPLRKLIYFRKVRVADQWLIVGSDFFLATPIWVRS